MRGISFEYRRPIMPPDPNRMDIACFIGFVPRRRGVELPEEISDWLERYGWSERAAQQDSALLDVPVPIEAWESFDQLFAWEKRLDRLVVISSQEAVADIICITTAEQLFKLSVNGEEREVTIPLGDYNPVAMAAFLDEQLPDIAVTTQTVAGNTYLVFSYNEACVKGHVSIFSQPSLGFPRAISRKSDYLHSYLGAAVRAFFAQGGRKCYVIRMGDPLPLVSTEAQRVQQLGQLLIGTASVWSNSTELHHLVTAFIPHFAASQDKPETWHGLDHLLGLSDVSYVSLPDLPELLAQTPLPTAHEKSPVNEEVFVECAPNPPVMRNDRRVAMQAPRCDGQGYLVWSRVITRLLRFLRDMSREVHLVVSFPLPGEEIEKDFKRYILEQWFPGIALASEQDIRSAFLQLCYPWLKTSESDVLPDQALPPEGVLTGMLASNALSRGAFMSAAGQNATHAYDLFPSGFFTPADEPRDAHADFYQHVSVFARVPGAIQLISDVTASQNESYRPAVVSRLMSLIVRAARSQGRSSLFEPMSHVTWRGVEKNLSTLLMSVFNAGGLRGRNVGDAFSVQCNESTMTQNDLDNGRIIANVCFQPAIPVQRIQVALSLEQGGQVVLQRV